MLLKRETGQRRLPLVLMTVVGRPRASAVSPPGFQRATRSVPCNTADGLTVGRGSESPTEGAMTVTTTMSMTDEVQAPGAESIPVGRAGPRIIVGIDDLRSAVGTHLGVSDWLTVEQSRIDDFAGVTRDEQWIHVDPARAEDGPFGATVAHGMLTLSLCSSLLWEVAVIDGMGPAINYGLNKVRFPAPLLVGSRVRMHVSISEVTDIARGVEVVYHLTYETQGQTKPPCVADLVFRYYA